MTTAETCIVCGFVGDQQSDEHRCSVDPAYWPMGQEPPTSRFCEKCRVTVKGSGEHQCDDVYMGRVEFTARLGFGRRPMDIDKREAGRELDALVAEKVLLRKTVKARTVEALGFAEARGEKPSSFPPRCVVMGLKEDDLVFEDGSRIPYYSADIGAAWEVADKLRLLLAPVISHEWHRDPEDDGQGDLPRGWACSRVAVDTATLDDATYFEVSTRGWSKAETASLAICRCALKTVQA